MPYSIEKAGLAAAAAAAAAAATATATIDDAFIDDAAAAVAAALFVSPLQSSETPQVADSKRGGPAHVQEGRGAPQLRGLEPLRGRLDAGVGVSRVPLQQPTLRIDTSKSS
jgi:hypothetical protein